MRPATLAELAARHGLPRAAAAAAPAGARLGRLPGPVRRRPSRDPRRRRRRAGGHRGRRGRRRGRLRLAGDPGRPDVVRRPARRPGRRGGGGAGAARPAAPIPVGVIVAASWARSPEHARQAGPRWPPGTPARASSASASPTTSGWAGWPTSRPRAGWPPRRGCWSPRTPASTSRPTHVRECVDAAGRRADRARRHGERRVPVPSTCWPTAASRWRSARRRTRRSGCRLARPGARCSPPGCRWRWAPTTRCCSGWGWPGSTRSPGRCWAARTRDLAALARHSVAASTAPAEIKSRLTAGIDAWLSTS